MNTKIPYPRKRMVLDINENLFWWIKEYAYLEGKPLVSVVQLALTEFQANAPSIEELRARNLQKFEERMRRKDG